MCGRRDGGREWEGSTEGKEGWGPGLAGGPLRELRAPLDLADVGGLKPLGPLGDLELDLVPLDDALETLSLDGAEMHEHVLAILLGDEAVPLCVVAPLHVTLSHLSATSLLRLAPL